MKQKPEAHTEPDWNKAGTQQANQRRNRRVTTPPPVGSDPHPAALNAKIESAEPPEEPGEVKNSNEDRLLNERPPHWAERD